MYGEKGYHCPYCGEVSRELKRCSRCSRNLAEMWVQADGIGCSRCSNDEVQIWMKDRGFGTTELKLKCDRCGEVPYEP